MKRTKKLQIDNTIYEADLDFRTAIECDRIARDKNIGNFERVLGIICTLFGENAIDNEQHYEKLLKWALNYLSFGKEIKHEKEPDMDYIEDEAYIKSSFKYDYKYNPYDEEFVSWEDFYNDLNNLSCSDIGNCCVLNRVRYIRNYDLSKVKDEKTRNEIKKAQEELALKRNKKEKEMPNKNEIKSAENFFKLLKQGRK